MALAPLLEVEPPRSRDPLRLVAPTVAGTLDPSPRSDRAGEVGPLAASARPAGRGPTSSRVRRRRRRRALAALGVAGATVALALPVSFLGGRPAASVPGPSTVGAGSRVYVVQPGDTLWSIATELDRGGDPRPLAEALARETGSSVVVPGERIRVP